MLTTDKPRNVFEALKQNNLSFRPIQDSPNFLATNAEPGSEDKISVFKDRLKNGLPLVHPEDRRHNSTSHCRD